MIFSWIKLMKKARIWPIPKKLEKKTIFALPAKGSEDGLIKAGSTCAITFSAKKSV
jgi:hypothetical protein